MGNFNQKRDAALKILVNTGIRKRNYLPSIFPFLWKLGIKIPPPHFLTFSMLVLVMGVPFGVSWIGFYISMFVSKPDFDLVTGLIQAVVLTAISGGGFATYYYLGRAVHKIPRWSAL